MASNGEGKGQSRLDGRMEMKNVKSGTQVARAAAIVWLFDEEIGSSTQRTAT